MGEQYNRVVVTWVRVKEREKMEEFQMLVAGSRDFTDLAMMERVLGSITSARKPSRVISGGAKGADGLAALWSEGQGIDLTVMYPNWKQYKRSAGYRRNEAMVAELTPGRDLVVVFFGPNGPTKGSQHTVDLASKRGLSIRVFMQEPSETFEVADDEPSLIDADRLAEEAWSEFVEAASSADDADHLVDLYNSLAEQIAAQSGYEDAQVMWAATPDPEEAVSTAGIELNEVAGRS